MDSKKLVMRLCVLVPLAFALVTIALTAGRISAASASQTECFSYGYACTPGYDATNTEGGWAWKYYGGSYALNANGYHNCTLYAAWRLEQNGLGNPGLWGNAVEWINHASHNNTPAVGSIAWWGSEVGGGFGHVAYVEQIRGSEVYIRADNYIGESSDGYTDAGWISASSVDAFLHPHDLQGAPPPPPPPPPALTLSNLLSDGGFEAGGVGWQMLSPGSGVGSDADYAGSAEDSSYGGPNFLEANWSTAGGSLYQDVSVNMAQNQSATFSMWLRLRPGVPQTGLGADLCLYALVGSNPSACQGKMLTTQWQQVQVTLTTPAATSTLRAQIYIPPGVNVDFDDGVLTENLLTDGGFEAGGVGWQMLSPGSGVGSDANYPGTPEVPSYGGPNYQEANWSTPGGSLYQDVTVNMTQNESATFSIWLRLRPGVTARGLSANLCLYALVGSNPNACQHLGLTTQWQQVQVTLTTPAGAGTLRAQIYLPPGVNVDFDDGVLTENLLTDGGFQAGGVGWQMLSPGSGVGSDANYPGSAEDPSYGGPDYQEANWSTPGGSLYQDVPVNMTQNQSATFSMWLRLHPGVTARGLSANLCLWALVGSNTSACQQRELTTQWQQVQVTLTIPAATSTLRAQIYMPPGVNVDFDDGSLGAPQTAEVVYIPSNESLPVISGSTSVGSTLACASGVWADAPTELTYSWSLDGTPIAGADGDTYTITRADEGHALTCRVTASNAAGEASAASAPISVPVPTPPASAPTGTSTSSSGTAPGDAPKSGVEASKTAVNPARLTSGQLLVKALAACRRDANPKRRASCQSAARRRYQHELQLARQRQRASAIAACKHVKNADKRKACVSAAERRYG